MTNKQKFLDEYTKLETWVDANLHSNVYEAARKAPLNMFQKDLELFRQVRNIITHKYDGFEDKDELFTINDALINYQSKLLKRIMSSILEMAVPISKIYSRKKEDYVLPVMNEMYERDYTHIPILDEEEHVLGVFSENSALRMMAGGYVLIEETMFIDIWNYINKPMDEYRLFDFISAKQSFCDCMTMFSGSINERRRLDILFITDDGTPRTPLKGLITTWDVAGK